MRGPKLKTQRQLEDAVDRANQAYDEWSPLAATLPILRRHSVLGGTVRELEGLERRLRQASQEAQKEYRKARRAAGLPDIYR